MSTYYPNVVPYPVKEDQPEQLEEQHPIHPDEQPPTYANATADMVSVGKADLKLDGTPANITEKAAINQEDLEQEDELETAERSEPAPEPLTATSATASESSKANLISLPSSRKFKSVGSPTYKVVGAPPPRQPSRFVTVGNDQYKTIKASISDISDIFSSKKVDRSDEEAEDGAEG
ncbi:hypothetical protein FRB91_005682, partial [Serendipita sp. 411]